MQDGDGEVWVGAVDGVHAPVGVDDDDPSCWLGEARELTHGGFGYGEMLQDAFAVGVVDAAVIASRRVASPARNSIWVARATLPRRASVSMVWLASIPTTLP